MKSFEDWVLSDPTVPLNQRPALPEGLWEDAKGNLIATCRCCERTYRYYGDIEDGFDQDMSYCGGSERCIP